MQSLGEILTKTSLPGSLQKKSNSSDKSPKTETTGVDYWDWYFAPGNSVRAWDEAHGVRLLKSETTGTPYFEADREIMFPEAEQPRVYPEYFENREFGMFVVGIYAAEHRQLAIEALRKSKLYAENHDKIVSDYDGSGLYYWSKTKGSGKTYLSTILGAELTRLGHRVRWYSMPNLLQEIKDGFDRESGYSSSEIINRAKNVEMLMLDDVGVEKQSAWVNETIFGILDYRLIHQMPTFFTSNLEPDELAYDERIKDRIKRMTELIQMPEDSIRKRLSSRSKLAELLKGR